MTYGTSKNQGGLESRITNGSKHFWSPARNRAGLLPTADTPLFTMRPEALVARKACFRLQVTRQPRGGAAVGGDKETNPLGQEAVESSQQAEATQELNDRDRMG